MQLVIIAGGKGTRLQERLDGLPKPMVDIGGRPLLEHQILLGRAYGFEDVVLLLGYGAASIREFFGDGSRCGVRIQYHVEETPLGTAGSVLSAWDLLDDRFMVMYGDVMLNVDLRRFWESHIKRELSASLFAHPNDHPQDSDLIDADSTGRIRAFLPYPRSGAEFHANLVNAALYVLDRDALLPWKERREVDFIRHIFPEMLEAGVPISVYRSPEYLKDAGTPKRLDAVTADYRSGRIQRGSLATPAPAVFLDRDGTLNLEVGYVTSADQLQIMPGVPEAIQRLNRAGLRTVLITNQPVVARGDCSEDELAQIHNKLETVLGQSGAYLDAIYYCPHHPDKGFAGERPEFKVVCNCRKPGTGLIELAVRQMNLDLDRSWLVGDSTVDIEAGRNAGVRTIVLETGHSGRDGRYAGVPQFTCSDLGGAVEVILHDAVAGTARENA